MDRKTLFLIGCMPVRLSFVAIAYYFFEKKYKYVQYFLGLIGLIIGFSFILSFIKNKKVGFFGGKVWWHNLRLVHALNYIGFGTTALLLKEQPAYMFLLFDAILGLISFITNYYLIKL